MMPLPDSVKRLIEGKTFANLATIIPDGSPQVTQTWVEHDGDLVLINTFEGGQKSGNVRRNPRVALTVSDPADPFNIATIRGNVNEVTFDGAETHVDRLAKKYLGLDRLPGRFPGMKRVLIKIEPRHVIPPHTDTRPKPGQTRSRKQTSKN